METAHEPPASPADSKGQMWRDLFVGRLTQLRDQIPRELRGAIQFEVKTQGPAQPWFVEIGRGSVLSSDGLCPHFDEWVIAEDSDLHALATLGDSSGAELRTIGEQDLLRRLLNWMAAAERPQRAGVWRGGKS